MDNERVDEMMLVGTTGGLWLNGHVLIAERIYGITWDGSSLYLGERGVETGGSVERRSPSLERLETIKAPVRDVHQILWADGLLYWTNTFEDVLEAWDGEHFYTIFQASDSGEDRKHLNSVWRDTDGCLWVVKHGRGQDPSRVRCLNTIWGFAFPGVTDLHNVYVEEGRAYVLSAGRVLSVGLAGGDVREMARVPDSYLRGLARGDGFWAVGRSLVGLRHERENGDGHVLLFDDGWKQVDRITLPGAGQVHEVRLLEGDRAHNGLPFP